MTERHSEVSIVDKTAVRSFDSTGKIPVEIEALVSHADASWHQVLIEALHAVAAAQPAYLEALTATDFVPTEGRLFAAFSQPLGDVRYVLAGEAPYPRSASATGFCFMDGAVNAIWSDGGLSKPVNKATSLRNFMKMLLVSDGRLAEDNTGATALIDIAREARMSDPTIIQTLPELQHNLLSNGFLLLNAALVFRSEVPPLREAQAWRPFMNRILVALESSARVRQEQMPSLILWGKVAVQVQSLPVAKLFPQVISEHPYNLSFIRNRVMQQLFGRMQLLRRNI